MPKFARIARAGTVLVVSTTALLGLGVAPATAARTAALSGVLRIDAGSCSGTGSYFRMVLPSGNASGPFLSNGDSPCGDQSITLLRPGADGGLALDTYQAEPSPAFDGSGNSLASAIIAPTRFYGVSFSVSTNPVDPQTGTAASAPTLEAGTDGSLSGDLRAWAASWNRQEFNQGAPKPDGSAPGNTALAHGTYDPATGAVVLDWASQIKGGPFDNFTGLWHLEGHVSPAGVATPAAATAAGAIGGSAGASPAAVGAAPAGATADAASSAADASTASAAPAANATVAAGAVGGAASTTVVPSKHWKASSWLVVLVALVGLAGLGAFFYFDRVVRSAAP